MKFTKMCEICGLRPAAVPDRERAGDYSHRICSSCHARRLLGDIQKIRDDQAAARALREGTEK